MHKTHIIFCNNIFLSFKETVKSVVMHGAQRFYWMSHFCLLTLHTAHVPKGLACVIPDCPTVCCLSLHSLMAAGLPQGTSLTWEPLSLVPRLG